MKNERKTHVPIRGQSIKAVYRDKTSEDSAFADNPLIMALPAEWEWEGNETPVIDKLTTYLMIDSRTLEKLSTARRILHLTKFKLQFFQVLSRHRDLERSLSMAIRFGYAGRNPAEMRYRKNLHDKFALFANPPSLFVSASNLGFSLLGSPGLGKTTSLARIVRLYPQIIIHEEPEFHHTQVVWLFLTCPHDKSTRGLCLLFFQEVDAILGSDFHEQYSDENESSLIAGMATVAATLSLGILIIDEIQFLSSQKSGGKDEMLKFFVQLENTLGIPIVLVGTHRAGNLIAGSPHQARRSVGMGGQLWKPLPIDDQEWEVFVAAMWEHQFLRNKIIRDEAIMLALHEETQGLFNYAVDLFYFAQLDAINNGTELISPESLKVAAQNHMAYNRPYIQALRSRNAAFAAVLEDIVSCDFDEHEKFFQNQLLLPFKQEQCINAAPIDPSSRIVHGGSLAESSIPSFQSVTAEIPGKAASHKDSRTKKRKLLGYPAGSIMAVCDEGITKKNIPPYLALKDEGLICDLSDFLSGAVNG